jgi:hypothetical protein
MDQALVLFVKGLIGGCVVTAFSVIGAVMRPRKAAGITSGAPSVAIASLAVTSLATGAAAAATQALGMIAGAAALVMWCLCGLDAVKRFGARKGSALATVAWLGTSVGLWAAALR